MKAIQKKLTMTEAERILVLVVESGLIYTAIWVRPFSLLSSPVLSSPLPAAG